jgi:hypothetical protein
MRSSGATALVTDWFTGQVLTQSECVPTAATFLSETAFMQ